MTIGAALIGGAAFLAWNGPSEVVRQWMDLAQRADAFLSWFLAPFIGSADARVHQLTGFVLPALAPLAIGALLGLVAACALLLRLRGRDREPWRSPRR
jgi:hypothetical protein